MDIQKVKENLRENPEKIEEYLQKFGFDHIKVHDKYITYARDHDSSPKGIVTYLEDNLPTLDYSRNISSDIFGYVMKIRGLSFKDVLCPLKSLLDKDVISDSPRKTKKKTAFGGYLDRCRELRRSENRENVALDDSVLLDFDPACNERFLKDGISLSTQIAFKLGYDWENQGITIPLYSDEGELIGVKERLNEDYVESGMKYFYKYPCKASQTLYGYAKNYAEIVSGKTVMIFEAEKSVMQAYTMGYNTALAIGSATLSKKQCQMIAALCPERIYLMHDKGLPEEAVMLNVEKLYKYIRMKDFSVYVWRPDESDPDKVSPTDLGRARFKHILGHELERIERTNHEEGV